MVGCLGGEVSGGEDLLLCLQIHRIVTRQKLCSLKGVPLRDLVEYIVIFTHAGKSQCFWTFKF